MKTLRWIVCLLTLATVGCGSLTATSPVSKADVAALETTLTAAIDTANVCLNRRLLPCQQPATRQEIIADIHNADAAFKRLQAATAAGQSAALAAFQEALTQLQGATR